MAMADGHAVASIDTTANIHHGATVVKALSMQPKSPRFEYSKKKLVLTGRAFANIALLPYRKQSRRVASIVGDPSTTATVKNKHTLFYWDKYNSSGKKNIRQYTYDTKIDLRKLKIILELGTLQATNVKKSLPFWSIG